MDDMDAVLKAWTVFSLIEKVANEGFRDKAAQAWLLEALAGTDHDAGEVEWAKQPRHSRIVADHLQGLIQDGKVSSQEFGRELAALVYVPIMIRVTAGGEALAGERFNWEPYGQGGFVAVSSDGTDWEVSGSNSWWEITVARWDHADYRTSSAERAKRIAEQLEAVPKPKSQSS